MPVPDDEKAKRLDAEKRPRHMWPCMAAVYAHLLVTLKAVGRQHGYAIAVHGSMTTDFDILAAPWIEEAAEPADLMEALRVSVNGTVRHEGLPTAKPHGRHAWTIFLGPEGSPHIDLSVMPKAPTK